MDEDDAVLAANAEFYAAFAAGNMARMEAIWSVAHDLTCIHPGWRRLWSTGLPS